MMGHNTKRLFHLPCLTLPTLVLVCCGIGFGADTAPPTHLIVKAGTPLRVALCARTPINSVGSPVNAIVVRPIYVGEYQVIPAGAKVTGKVLTLEPVDRATRLRAVTGGDFTPLHQARLEFDNLILPDGHEIAFHSIAVERNAKLVKLNSRERQQSETFFDKAHNQLAGMTQDQKKMFKQIRGPGKFELAEDWFYSNLPYHPQSLARGSLFDVDLQEPLEMDVPCQEAMTRPAPTKTTVLRARMLTTITSKDAEAGMPVEAILTEPVRDEDHGLSLPEGTRLTGTITYAKPAHSFGRSGELRFRINRLALPEDNEMRSVDGILAGAELNPHANAIIDTEGGTHAHSKRRWVEPVTYAVFAGALYFGFSQHQDESPIIRSVFSNGFGFTGNFLGSLSESAAMGMSYYGLARSVVLNILLPGQNVVFPKDTLLEIKLADTRPRTKTDSRLLPSTQTKEKAN